MTIGNPTEAFRLDDKVVIVTGASSGLGERFARVADAAGARVVVTARREDRLDALAAELRDPLVVAADFSTDAGPPTVVESTLAHFGQIDVLVNNAGFSRVVPAIDDTVEAFRDELQVDLVAPYDLAIRCGRWMIEQQRPGVVVNIASILGQVAGGALKVPGYAAAKGGLIQLTRELASQWARKGVRVNAIGPGWFETEMNSDAMFGEESGLNYVRRGAPMGRGGQVHELDGALLFLASDASTFMTGQTLFVDGGWTIT